MSEATVGDTTAAAADATDPVGVPDPAPGMLSTTSTPRASPTPETRPATPDPNPCYSEEGTMAYDYFKPKVQFRPCLPEDFYEKHVDKKLGIFYEAGSRKSNALFSRFLAQNDYG